MPNSFLTQRYKIVRRGFLALVVMITLGFAATTGAAAQEIVAINAGGPAVSNSGGGDASFVADVDFSGGGSGNSTTKTINLTQPGANAAPMAVYQTSHTGTTTYTIPNLTAGSSYTVLLHFSENYWSATKKREFNVAINGTTVLTNFDIYATAGAEYKALVETFTATANSAGKIVIALTKGADDQPAISGLEIRGASAPVCSAVTPAPTGLTVTATTSSSVSLSWTAPIPPANCTVSSYVVYDGTASPPTTVAASGVTGTTYTVSGLAANTTYYLAVVAVDAYGTSAHSTIISDKTSTASSAPVITTQPVGQSVTVGQTATFSVVATGTPAPTYQWYKNSAAISGATAATYTTPATVSTDNGATFKVVVTNSAGSVTSNTVTLTVTSSTCAAVTAAPTALAMTATTSSSVSLSWTAPTPPANCTVSSYVVYDGTASPPTTVAASGVAGTTYTVTGLAASTTYYFSVAAVDAFGTSAHSTIISDTTSPASNQTGYVSINAGGPAENNSGGGDNSFVADEYYSGGTTKTVTNTITVPASIAATAAPMAVYQSARQGVVTYTIPGLTAGTINIVRLHFAELYFSAAGKREFNVAINGATVLTNFDIYATAGGAFTGVVEQFTATANSSGDIVIAFTSGAVNQPMFNGIEVLDATSCTTIPAAPTGLAATAVYPSVINLSWAADTPPAHCTISSYNVYGGTTANPTTLIASGLTGTTYSNTGLTASTTYYYVVKAVDAYGTSAASTQASTTTPAPAEIAPPTSLTAVGSSDLQIDLRWVASTAPAPNTTPVNYSVYRSTTTPFTPSASNKIGATVGITNYLDSNYNQALGVGVAPSTTYYYMVVATTLSGASEAATASATSLPATPSAAAPAALTGLTAMAQNANEIDLIWNSTNSGVGTVVTTYYIYRSTTSPFTPASTNLIGTTKSNWFQDALASASTQYYYQVLAKNSIGTSPSSATVTATTPALNPELWGGAPFWDASGLPAKQNVVMMKFLNRTNGKYSDDQITWTATINGVASQFTIAQQPYYDMPANSSGRMYFFLNDPTLAENNTNYWDFIEFTVGPTSINMDTTRVDALGVKLAFNLTCGDGTNIALGENEQTFTEDRSVTLQRYLSAVPSSSNGDFQACETTYSPYRIIEPGGAGFNAGGPYQNYYATYVSDIWSFNGITIPEAGANGSGLGCCPSLSAAIYRHSAPTSGTAEFNAAGALTNQGMWGNPAGFYQADPYDHYAQWIDAQAINMQQYAFPYNDAGGYSADIGCSNPETLLVSVGW